MPTGWSFGVSAFTLLRVLSRCLGAVWLIVAVVGRLEAAPETTAQLAERVIVLANSEEPESVRLAEYYAEARGVPAANIVALPLSRGESMPWPEFVTTLFNPLQEWLVAHDWVDGIGMELFDEYGRRKYAMSGHRISFLVVCRGVPLKISNEAAWLQNELGQRLPAQFRRNDAALDSELTVISASGTPVNGFIPSPLFRQEKPTTTQLEQIVRVTRLDGPSFMAAKDMVTTAIRVEQDGLIGRAYTDTSGPFAHGDRWLEAAGEEIATAGWDLQKHANGGTMAGTDRADGMALYLGWYAGGVNGPFVLPGFRLARGAIALHIHSYSASSLRLENGGGWTGPLVARGAAATFGNVEEPYLEFTHRPDILMAALLRGARLGEAAYEALPGISWQAIALGDPLYQPFAVRLADQVARIDELPPLLAPYVAIREMQRREGEGDMVGALEWGRAQLKRTPSLALGWAVAQRLHAAGDDPAAAVTLGFAKWVRRAPAADWGLVKQIATALGEWGDGPTSTLVWRTLFAYPLPTDVRKSWLEAARQSSTMAGETNAALEWSRALIDMVPGDQAAH